jgi:chromosome segregation protein
LIEIDNGWEAATAAALGSLADAVVVKDLSAAVSALTTLRRENLGKADVLVYEPGQQPASSAPGGLKTLLSHVRSREITELLSSLLATTVVAENASEAEAILRQHRNVTVVTRDGDVITSHRARGGSASSSSLIEIQALVADLGKKLEELNHTCDRLKFEIAAATTDVEGKQSAFDQTLAKLNESDARIAALTEQLAVSGQNIKSATAEVERLTVAINEASAAKARDENELSIARNQMQHHGDIAEPDHSRAETIRNTVSQARTTEVEA